MSSPSLKAPSTLAIGAITAIAVIGMAALSAVLAERPRPLARTRRALRRQPPRLLCRPDAVQRARRAALDMGALRGRRQSRRHRGRLCPEDAIPSAASYMRALLRAADGNLSQALFGYNHSRAYVSAVLAHARTYARLTDQELAAAGEVDVTTGCADPGELAAAPANLRAAQRVASPRTFRALPGWAMAGARGSGAVDARLYDDAAGSCGATTCASAPPARAATTPTATAPRSTWSPPTGTHRRSGTAQPEPSPMTSAGARPARAQAPAPACQLAPAIQFIGYDGYPDHGSPRACTGDCPAHLHLSWASPCYGTSSLSGPCEWVMAFDVLPADYPAAVRPGP